MAFSVEDNCYSGLNALVYYAAELYDARNFYLPANTMKFGLAANKLTESFNQVSTYSIFLANIA